MKGNPTIAELRAVRDRYPVDQADVRAALSRIPVGWHQVATQPHGAVYQGQTLQVIISVERYDDNQLWLHVSAVGRTGRTAFYLPTWTQMKRIKEDFIGEKWAYSVLPPTADYVNQNEYCLHLYARMDGSNALPDFTRGLGVL
ncbi:MAG TPA: hypothetical protein VGG61_14250 [Gemmataceae bacterium]|jgi:hypothetical protein